ncbi:hypothetical protein KRP22_006249 [Phytophthora ramorum]|nr:hypothetical protein KRP22_2618 [Phytophthora ramorum]
MGKDRFVVNPFDELNLSSVEKDTLRDFGHNFIDQNIEKYEEFISNAQRQVDQTKWKLIKTKDDTRNVRSTSPLEAAREDAMGPSKRIVYFDSSLTSSSVSS